MFCVVDGDGNSVEEATLETDPDATGLSLAEWRVRRKHLELDGFP